MADRNTIVKFCEEYLQVKNFSDYCHNGLQVAGVKEVKKIISGVSLSRQLIETAIEKKAQMLLVHHGIFGNMFGNPPQIKGIVRDRLQLLLENNLNLLGFHLPLDAHPLIGNNISLCRLLGVKNPAPFDVGFIGELEQSLAFEKFVQLVNSKLPTTAWTIAAGPKKVKRVGIISGGSSPDFAEAWERGADTYICGDIREEVVRAVEESGINLINAGHYNTEKLGVKNLGELVAKKFKIEAEFIDIPCEV